jgi:hypothetical protein
LIGVVLFVGLCPFEFFDVLNHGSSADLVKRDSGRLVHFFGNPLADLVSFQPE